MTGTREVNLRALASLGILAGLLPFMNVGVPSATAAEIENFGDLKVGSTAIGSPANFCTASGTYNLRLTSPVHVGEAVPFAANPITENPTVSIVHKDEGFFAIIHLADDIVGEDAKARAVLNFISKISEPCVDSDYIQVRAFGALQLSAMLAHDPPVDIGYRRGDGAQDMNSGFKE